jgi:hypothetical protein
MGSGLVITHFAAWGGDLVYLVYLVFLVYLVSLVWVNKKDKKDKTDPRTRLTASVGAEIGDMS